MAASTFAVRPSRSATRSSATISATAIFGVRIFWPALKFVPSGASLWRGYLVVTALLRRVSSSARFDRVCQFQKGRIALAIVVDLVLQGLEQDLCIARWHQALDREAAVGHAVELVRRELAFERGRQAAGDLERLERCRRIGQQGGRALAQ